MASFLGHFIRTGLKVSFKFKQTFKLTIVVSWPKRW